MTDDWTGPLPDESPPTDYRALLRWCLYLLAGSAFAGLLLVTDTVAIFAVLCVVIVASLAMAYALSEDPDAHQAEQDAVDSVQVLPGWAADWHRRLHEDDAA